MSIPLIVTPRHGKQTFPRIKPDLHRPFLVKEEKLMLTIKENQNPEEIVRVMKQVVGNCVITEDFDVEKISGTTILSIFSL